LEDLPPNDQGICEFFMSLKVVFDTTTLLTKEFLSSALKAYTGTPPFLPLKKKLKIITTNHLFVFADRMLSNISKAKLAELTRKMRAAASLPKESLSQKRRAPTVVAQIQSNQHEHTTLRLVFERKRPTTTSPTEHSHLDG